MSITESHRVEQLDAGLSFAATPALRIAVVDRDTGFGTVLRRRAESLGWQQRDLTQVPAIDALVSMRLHALVIDPTLLGPQWAETIEYLRGNLPEMAIVVTTAPSSVGQRVRGIRAGADDWITKPCHPEELIARIESIMRRRKPAQGLTREPILAGDLSIRADQFQAFCEGRSLDLTRREFELLHLLADNPGNVLEREEIYQRVWGFQMAHGDRSVDVFIRKLRQKITLFSPGWDYIHTHFGVGYRFSPELPVAEKPVSAKAASAKRKAASVGKAAA
ncbi:MAG: response regulator transcription factor [Solirubrobacterales bacterium]|nr:response regulator transcription factor [Solirubrobacterales bacterium]